MAGALAGLVFVLRFAARRHQITTTRRRDAIAQTVKALGGVPRSGSRTDGFALSLPTGVRLEATFASDSDGPGHTWIVAEASIPTDLVIGSEGISTLLAKLVAGPDVETGERGAVSVASVDRRRL